ncbi:MAG: hypothetical protein H6739_17810 [Alphaproteobacteria bacterium]|nr:hypothetical protein [Alphaproteobacteria bacterium]
MRPRLALVLLAACSGKSAPVDDSVGPTDTAPVWEIRDALSPLSAVNPAGRGIVHINDIAPVEDDALALASYAGAFLMDVADPTAPEALDRGGQALYWANTLERRVALSGREGGTVVAEAGEGWARVTPLDLADAPEGVALTDGLVLIAARAQGLLVVDVATQQIQGVLDLPGALDVVMDGGVAWVADTERGLVGVDLTDPSAPVEVGVLPIPGIPSALAGDGAGRVAVAAGSRTVLVDVHEPVAPVELAALGSGGVAYRVAFGDGLLAVADWSATRVYDLADPARPRLLGLEDATDAAVSVAFTGDTLWVGDWDVLRGYTVDRDAHGPELDVDTSITLLPEQGLGAVNVTVSNPGDMPLTLSAAGCDDGTVTLSPAQLTLEPGAGGLLTVETATPGARAVTCTVETNDADEAIQALSVQVDPPGLGVGDVPEPWTLPDLDGTLHSLGDHLGEVVMVTIFSPT